MLWVMVRREERELFILIGKSNHSDLHRKFRHRSAELSVPIETAVHAWSTGLAWPASELLVAARTSGSRDFRLPSGLLTGSRVR
jgi:hypothetical protein